MAYLALWTSKPSEQSITSPISEKSGFAIATGLNRTCKNISLKYTEHFTILLELNLSPLYIRPKKSYYIRPLNYPGYS